MFSLFLSLALHVQPAEAPQLDAEGRIIHVEVFDDFDADGVEDRAYISQPPEGGGLDLTIEASTAGRFDYPGVLWGRYDWGGQAPALTLAGNGSLVLHTMNESVGRSRWSQRLTIAYRDGDFRRAGLTYTWRDTINIANFGECDVNFLTGRGVRKGVEIAVPVSAIPLPGGMEDLPPECRAFELDPIEITGDVDGDGQEDRIIADTSDLMMMTSLTIETSSSGEYQINSVFFGSVPVISVSDRGSVFVDVTPDDLSESRLTLVLREGQFLVAGVTSRWRERYDSETVEECDVNLLTGRGVRNGEAYTTEIEAFPLTGEQELTPDRCEI